MFALALLLRWPFNGGSKLIKNMQTETCKPNITLSTGRVVRHTRMANGATDASIVGENPEMTPAEWEEYCAVLVAEVNKPEPVRTWYAGQGLMRRF